MTASAAKSLHCDFQGAAGFSARKAFIIFTSFCLFQIEVIGAGARRQAHRLCAYINRLACYSLVTALHLQNDPQGIGVPLMAREVRL